VLYVVGKDAMVEQRVIERGNLIDGLRIIRTGIAPGDRVIISGMQRARPGLKVAAKPGKIEAFPAGVTRGIAPAFGQAK
jgi:multidrug efflux pump subunit AcrA (membrane-fusion protein)